MSTESRNPRSVALDRMSALEVVELMNNEERTVLDVLDHVVEGLAAAADRVRTIYEAGGRLFLLGSGTSGRLAVQEVAELPPTFGVNASQFIAFIASGPTGGPAAITVSEDDVMAAPAALAAAGCGRSDGVVGLAASGTTPFVVAGVEYALAAGAWTCGIANNPSTRLLDLTHVAIFLDTGPEVVTGSTRLKAGTGQKLALNRITTAAMTTAGKVISNLMVEVSASNEKLRGRCISIVAELTASDAEGAEALLRANDWNVRAAVAAAPTHGEN